MEHEKEEEGNRSIQKSGGGKKGHHPPKAKVWRKWKRRRTLKHQKGGIQR